jgi:hypothetical protein
MVLYTVDSNIYITMMMELISIKFYCEKHIVFMLRIIESFHQVFSLLGY